MNGTAETKPKKRQRRSSSFMSAVYSVMDSTSMPFIDAIREVDARRDEIQARDDRKSRETMRWENQLATWNASVPIGTPVMYRHIVGGPESASRTCSKAWALGHGQPVVKLEDESGGWCLDFVRVGVGPIPVEDDVDTLFTHGVRVTVL